jgi:hypothetical protein
MASSRIRDKVHATYCAIPNPYDQFSFGTSTRLITASSRITVLLKALHNVVSYLITLFVAEPLAQSANKLALP